MLLAVSGVVGFLCLRRWQMRVVAMNTNAALPPRVPPRMDLKRCFDWGFAGEEDGEAGSVEGLDVTLEAAGVERE